MKRAPFCTLILAGLAGCSSATGPVGDNPLPQIAEPDKAVEVVVIRKSSHYLRANPHFITLDDKKIFSIDAGEYTRFKVSHGAHTLGVSCDHGVIPLPTVIAKENHIEVDLAPGTKAYYFIGRGGIDCMSFKPIEAGEGEAQAAKSTFRPFDPDVKE